MSIFVFATSFIFPILCNACAVSSDSSFLFDSGDAHELGSSLAWLMTGILVTIGYSIPFEMFRVTLMPLVEFLLTCGGGTVILVSIIVFQFVVIRTNGDSV